MNNKDEKYRTILEHMADGFITYDAAGNYTYVNKIAGELLGYAPTELIGKNIWSVFSKEEHPEFNNAFQHSMREQKHFVVEAYYPSKDFWYESHFYPSPDEMIVFIRDISERKRHAASILNEMGLSDTIINELPGIFYMADRATFMMLRWNKNLELITGYTQDEIQQMRTMDFVEPAQRDFVLEKRKVAISTGKVDADLKLVTKDGNRLDYYFKVMSIEHNGQACMLGIGIDITEQKHTENILLKRNYEINERIKELACLYKLSELTTTPGKSVDEIIHKYTEIIPPAWQYPEITCTRIVVNNRYYLSHNFKETIWKQEAPVVLNKTKVGKVEIFYMEERPHEFEGPFLKEERSLLNSLSEMLGNAIEKKNAEISLKRTYDDIRKLNAHLQTIREEERTHIAREIHDELGQQLAGLKMHLALCTRKMINTDPDLLSDVKDINNLINTAVLSMKKIASDLRPGALDDLGLIAALEWQAREFEKHSGVQCNFIFPKTEIQFNKLLATAVFRIFQESLTNVMKYANASLVESKLEIEGSHIQLTVKDNGSGFDLESLKGNNCFGLLGMKERALAFGGDVVVNSKKGSGTTISLSLPILTPNTVTT